VQCEVCAEGELEDAIKLQCGWCNLVCHGHCADPPLQSAPFWEWLCPECEKDALNMAPVIGACRLIPSCPTPSLTLAPLLKAPVWVTGDFHSRSKGPCCQLYKFKTAARANGSESETSESETQLQSRWALWPVSVSSDYSKHIPDEGFNNTMSVLIPPRSNAAPPGASPALESQQRHPSHATSHIWLVTFGKCSLGADFKVLYWLNLKHGRWQAQNCTGVIPESRKLAGLCFHECASKPYLVLFGGQRQVTFYQDLHILDLESGLWTQHNVTGVHPLPRSGHSMTSVGSNIIVWGGTGYRKDGRNFDDLHTLHFFRPDATEIVPLPLASCASMKSQQSQLPRTPPASPAARNQTQPPANIWICSKCTFANQRKNRKCEACRSLRPKSVPSQESVPQTSAAKSKPEELAKRKNQELAKAPCVSVFARRIRRAEAAQQESMSDCVDLTGCPDGCEDAISFWSQAVCTGARPCRRAAHSATGVGSSLFVYGGCDQKNSYLCDFFVLDLVVLCWSEVKMSGQSPPARILASLEFVGGNRFLVFGGCKPETSIEGDCMAGSMHEICVAENGLTTPSTSIGDSDGSRHAWKKRRKAATVRNRPRPKPAVKALPEEACYKAVAKSYATVPAGPWECPQCTFANQAGEIACAVCGSRKARSPRLTPTPTTKPPPSTPEPGM
jgi:hypothetical protein